MSTVLTNSLCNVRGKGSSSLKSGDAMKNTQRIDDIGTAHRGWDSVLCYADPACVGWRERNVKGGEYLTCC